MPEEQTGPVTWNWRTLRKSAGDRMLGGVCGGLGENTPAPSWVWRVVFLVLLFGYGTGVVAYIILWICMPPAKRAGG